MDNLTSTGSKDARQEGSHHAADSVKLKDIHALIDVQPVVDVVAQGTYNGCQESNDGSQPDTDITSSRSDTDQTGNGTLTSTDDAKLALVSNQINHDLKHVSTPS